jgi:hypothetical protein
LHNYYLKESFEDGLYKPFCVSDKLILIQSIEKEYPKWENLFLDEKPTKKINVLSTKDPVNLNKAYAKLIRLMDEDEGFQLHFWNNILSFGNEYEVRWYGDKKQIIFINSTHRAVVMPIHVD